MALSSPAGTVTDPHCSSKEREGKSFGTRRSEEARYLRVRRRRWKRRASSHCLTADVPRKFLRRRRRRGEMDSGRGHDVSLPHSNTVGIDRNQTGIRRDLATHVNKIHVHDCLAL